MIFYDPRKQNETLFACTSSYVHGKGGNTHKKREELFLTVSIMFKTKTQSFIFFCISPCKDTLTTPQVFAKRSPIAWIAEKQQPSC